MPQTFAPARSLLAASLLALAGQAFAQGAAAEPPPPAALVEAARAAARADRNAESARLFAQALALAPGRRAELLHEYADQLTYSGRARDAVPLYRELLAARGGPDRLPVLRGLGLALLWSDQPTAARAVYEEILAAQPRDQDASRKRAQALAWSGRQRQAIAALQSHLQAWPDDAEARVQLAQSQAWLGRPDQARASLAQPGLAGRQDAARLRSDLDLWAAPRTRVDAQRSTQSDALEIGQLRVEHAVSFAGGLGTAGARVDGLEFEREDGSDAVRVTRPMLLGRYRFSDAAELHAEIGNEHIAPRGARSMDRLVYASWFTLWPGDLLRFDLSTSRSTFDNLRSLRLGLTATQYGLSADFTPTERQRYTARAERGLYSDGNRRRRGELEAEWRLTAKPELWVGARHTRMRFARQLDNGYFNPLTFEATLATARLAWRPDGEQGRWDLRAGAAWGREHANPDGSKPAYDASLRAGYRIDPKTRLEARLQRFSTRTGSFSGFARTTAGLALERSW